MAISTGAAILGSAVIGGVMSNRAAKKAAGAQGAASEAAIEEERRQYDLNRADLSPYREAGGAALGRIRDLLGLGGGSGELNRRFTEADFWSDPVTRLGYESGLNQGMTSLDRMFGARGMRNSGAAAKELTRFATDYTGQKANDAYARFYGDQDRTFNRLSGVAGTGQTATQNTAALGNASAGRVGDIMTNLGNARGASAIARGNAWGNALGTVGNWWGQNAMLDKLIAGRNPGWSGSIYQP